MVCQDPHRRETHQAQGQCGRVAASSGAYTSPQWYASRYGPNWPAGVGHRLGAAHSTPKGIAYYWQSKALGGWSARVREWNRLTEITGRRKRGHTGDLFDTVVNCRLRQHHWKQSGGILVFRTRADAESAVLE